MTGDEMERAIEFLLQGQANHEARLGELTDKVNQLTEQVAETNKVVQLNAETQTQFIQIVTRHIEAQVEINASLRASIDQGEVRIKQAEVKIKQADVSIKQADAMIKQADVKIKQADVKIKQADVKIKQAEVRINQEATRIKQADARITRTDTRLDRLEALVERYIEGRSNGQG